MLLCAGGGDVYGGVLCCFSDRGGRGDAGALVVRVHCTEYVVRGERVCLGLGLGLGAISVKGWLRTPER